MAEMRRMRPWLGTFVEIRAAADHAQTLSVAVENAFSAVARVHALMSFHDANSDVSRLNRSAFLDPVMVDPWTFAVISAGLKISARSLGLFDLTVAAQLVADGFLPVVANAQLPEQKASWQDIELLDDRRVYFRRPLWIDLGGIAKGFAVDQAVTALIANGARCGIVNAGGDLRVFGGIDHVIQVRDPSAPKLPGHTLTVCDAALATSAPYFSLRRHGSRRVSPLVNPRSGRSCTRNVSVSVQAPDCLHADALTKVVLADTLASQEILNEYGAQALVLKSASHRVVPSCGLRQTRQTA